MKRGQKQTGFTIVELLIVIVVIAILASITVVAFNGIRDRAATTKRDADIAQYYKAIMMARENSGVALRYVTGSTYSAGQCVHSSYNTTGTEPRDLPKTHGCWTTYYSNLSTIGQAAGMVLTGLREGDARGNPYIIDENEGEAACPSRDALFSLNGSGVTMTVQKYIPRFDGCV